MKIEKRNIILIFFALGILLNSLMVYAHGEETFAQAEELIKQRIDCNNLTTDQLEIIGEYYMEQMHPGELHEIMDRMMGGEGSESLKQAHINMGNSFYCGEHQFLSSNMMNIMMSRNNQFRGGMMNMMGYGTSYGLYSGAWMILWWIIGTALIAFIFGIIFWWTYNLIVKNNRRSK
ncbi:hypothetical protein J4216_05430 [Candidatus Woesearchaeota archaeon]|nr:hypothetical protein [Candidatus Woesearchaeota archaeon]